MEPAPLYTPASAKSSTSLALPIAIIVGFGMIATAIYMTGTNTPATVTTEPNTAIEEPAQSIRPLDETDHIRGNPNAQIMMIEYSDYECPYCKQFHDTMNRVMDEYGSNGQIAWTYRHMPFIQLHPNAVRIALASECVAELGGNDAFWQFSDLIFDERALQEPTDMSKINSFATSVGVAEDDFVTCLKEDRHLERVQADLEDVLAAGAEGTPYTVIMVGDQQAVINGAQSYATVKQIIDTLLNQIEVSAG